MKVLLWFAWMEIQKSFTPEMFLIFDNRIEKSEREKPGLVITLVSKKALKGGVYAVSITKNEEVNVLRLTEMSRTSG